MLVAYFDCFSGVSGDMLLGALVDAGLELSDLQADVDRLGVGARLRASSVDRCGIRATRVEVDIDGQSMTPQREQHLHAGGHAHGAHDHSHLRDVLATIDASSLDIETKQAATRVFRRLTEAEAEVQYVKVIKNAAASGNWQAAAWWLERRKAADYRRVDRLEATGDGGGPQETVVRIIYEDDVCQPSTTSGSNGHTQLNGKSLQATLKER